MGEGIGVAGGEEWGEEEDRYEQGIGRREKRTETANRRRETGREAEKGKGKRSEDMEKPVNGGG